MAVQALRGALLMPLQRGLSFFLLFSLLFSPQLLAFKFSPNPIANPGSVIIRGNARFTVLTPRVIRFEWAQDGKFKDLPTIKIINRYLPVPKFNVTTNGELLRIQTEYLVLLYKLASGPFTAANLNITVSFKNQQQKQQQVTWQIGAKPTGNLLGTVRTLDGTNGPVDLYCPDLSPSAMSDSHCTLGLISRDGWAVFEDEGVQISNSSQPNGWPWFTKPTPNNATCAISPSSRTECFVNGNNIEQQCKQKGCCYDPSDNQQRLVKENVYFQRDLKERNGWRKEIRVEKRSTPSCFFPVDPTTRQDFYFFGHGLDFTSAMTDFISLSGPVPLFPRYIFGTQYSRWHAYNEEDEYELLEQGYQNHNIPLDVLVLDMDWHTTYYKQTTRCNPPTDGWNGFTWNKNLFPDPSRFLGRIKQMGLHVTNNLHTATNNYPHYGVQCTEERYPQMAKAMGIDPSTNNSVLYDIADEKYMANFFNIVLKPLGGANGIDYWWIDWQQGEDLIAPQINPTIWINYLFTNAPTWWSSVDRPLVMARWGGLGNHRFGDIGFSGDVVTSWNSLAWQPYFTATATNVGFLWSHDIGGFYGQPDPEIYTRWIQWGAFSNILRTHCDGKQQGGGYDRAIWLYPYENFVIMREAFELRSLLVPYIYTSSYLSYNTGLGLLRPLYYAYPFEEEAYNNQNIYNFGPDLVVSPITTPADNITQLNLQTIWIPPGKWIEFYSGKLFSGPATIQRNYTLWEIPIFVPAGAVIPMLTPDRPIFGSAKTIPQSLHLLVFPGLSSGQSRTSMYYDDDGITNAYNTQNAYFITNVTVNVFSDSIRLTVQVPQGNGFATMPTNRNYLLEFRGNFPPSKVTFNNKAIDICKEDLSTRKLFQDGDCWSYYGQQLAVQVQLVSKPIRTAITVELFGTQSNGNSSLLTSGFQRKIVNAQHVKNLLDDEWGTYFLDFYPSLLRAAETARNFTLNSVRSSLQQFDQLWANALKEVQALSSTPEKTLSLALLQMN